MFYIYIYKINLVTEKTTLEECFNIWKLNKISMNIL